MRKTYLRIAGIFLAAGVAATIASAPAAAHVTAHLDGAGPGDYGLITLRVPTEAGTATTTKVEMRIPDDIQLKTVLVEPLPGWRVDTTKREIPPITEDDGTQVTEVVSSVTWTATNPGIAPGQFTQFGLEVGPLPDVSTIALPTVQIFSDGTVKSWTQQATGDDDPEFPEPAVTLGEGPGGTPGAGNLASVLTWTALGFSVIALALGIFAIDRANASQRSANASVSGAQHPSSPAETDDSSKAE